MVTDPVRRIRGERYDLPVTFGVRDVLRRLAAKDPSLDAPYLTITLDWRPAGDDPGRAAAKRVPCAARRAPKSGARSWSCWPTLARAARSWRV